MAQVQSTTSFSIPSKKLPNPLKTSTRAFSSPSQSPSPPPIPQPTRAPAQSPPAPSAIKTTRCTSNLSTPLPFATTTSNQLVQPPDPKIKTRRRIYLSRHPSYHLSPDLELSHPLLYDRLVRRYQSAVEREDEGKKRGYARVLEAGLWRGEAVRGMGGYNENYAKIGRGIIGDLGKRNGEEAEGDQSASGEGGDSAMNDIQINENGPGRPSRENGNARNLGRFVTNDYVPADKEEGMRMWREEMEARFLRGEDEDFTYKDVDESEEYDDRGAEEREMEEEWFAREEEEWIEDGKLDRGGSLTGETGVQDF